MLNKQSGNVLFLILICVALFAALSYVVLNTTRSGGGSISKERAELAAAALLHYPLTIKTAVMRMAIDGKNIDDITGLFDYHAGHAQWAQIQALGPEYFNLLVFHPQGGGVIYQEIPRDTLSDHPDLAGYPKNWIWPNLESRIPGIGSDEFDENLMLYGVKPEICMALNKKLGVVYSTNGGVSGCTVSTAAPVIGICGDNSWCASDPGCEHVLDGKPVFCGKFDQILEIYGVVYALIER